MLLTPGCKTIVEIKPLATVAPELPKSSTEELLLAKHKIKKGKKLQLVYYPSSRDLRVLPLRKQISLKSAMEIAVKYNMLFTVHNSVTKKDVTGEFLSRYLSSEFSLFLKQQNAKVLLNLLATKEESFNKTIRS
jgi:hypothetical protein